MPLAPLALPCLALPCLAYCASCTPCLAYCAQVAPKVLPGAARAVSLPWELPPPPPGATPPLQPADLPAGAPLTGGPRGGGLMKRAFSSSSFRRYVNGRASAPSAAATAGANGHGLVSSPSAGTLEGAGSSGGPFQYAPSRAPLPPADGMAPPRGLIRTGSCSSLGCPSLSAASSVGGGGLRTESLVAASFGRMQGHIAAAEARYRAASAAAAAGASTKPGGAAGPPSNGLGAPRGGGGGGSINGQQKHAPAGHGAEEAAVRRFAEAYLEVRLAGV